MKMVNKTYRFRIFPNKEQEVEDKGEFVNELVELIRECKRLKYFK